MRYIHAKVARTAGVAPALGVLEALTLYRVVRMERDAGIAPAHRGFADRRLSDLANPSQIEMADYADFVERVQHENQRQNCADDLERNALNELACDPENQVEHEPYDQDDYECFEHTHWNHPDALGSC